MTAAYEFLDRRVVPHPHNGTMKHGQERILTYLAEE